MTQSPSDLCPYSINIIVEGLEGKDLELWLLVGEEAKDSGCRDETGHGDEDGRGERHTLRNEWWAGDPTGRIKEEIVDRWC